MSKPPVDMLLVEPVTLLRRTVSLTARSLGLGDVHEAASMAMALKLLNGKRFHGAVIALQPPVMGTNEPMTDAPEGTGEAAASGQANQAPQASIPEYQELALIDAVRGGLSACHRDMPIAVMVEQVSPELVVLLRERKISRVILKPFRARDLLDAFAAFAAARRGS
jgi:CheY-like chemotaxis protein